MKKRLSTSSLVILCSLAIAGCDDESISSASSICSPQCSASETCVKGICQCGDEVCSDGEACINNKCDNPECTSENCSKDECTGVNCNQDQCTGDECESQNGCNDQCSEEETCVDNVCKCGDKLCEDGEVCHQGNCETAEEDPYNGEDPVAVCEITCETGTQCIDGECVPEIIECNPECDAETEYCDDNGQCQAIINLCTDCAQGETCVDGKCMCGSSSCNEDEICENNICIAIDPCTKLQCEAGQTCENGTCKTVKLSFAPKSLDVMLSSLSDKLVVTKSTDEELIWTFDGKSADTAMSNVKCLVSSKDGQNTYSTKLSDCIKINKTKKTETVQFIHLIRHPKSVKVAVKTADGSANAEATINIKPYFDMDGFDKISGLVYRNGYCAGHKLEKSIAKYDYKDHEDTGSSLKANLGGLKTEYGAANPYGSTTFNEDEKTVFDKDMYTKYIRPHMFKVDGNYYGTRASVVAAARFLILQFPYDIPYQMISLSNTVKARSHYVQTLWRDAASSLSKTRIFGLNLTSNVYNSSIYRKSENIIRKTAVPWGAAYSSTSSEKYPYNGLECSGFVTWALNNGRMNLGDWKTKMFAKSGDCVKDGKVVRNYKCKELVNNAGQTSWSNRNNSLFSAYTKLNTLKDSDFKELNNKSESALKTIFKDAKAGDILWKGTWIDKSAGTYGNGHIAMIIGIKRNAKTDEIEAIEVGEAVYRAGNKLSKYSVKTFKTSGWVDNSTQACFLIKMDNVYNYYSSKHPIQDKAENVKSDCPNAADKLTGNCYNYTDMYNLKFNDAIKNKTW